MVIEAAFLPKNMSSLSVRTFVIPFYYGYSFGIVTVNGTVINYGTGPVMAKSSGFAKRLI
jgi:hypothetical protein